MPIPYRCWWPGETHTGRLVLLAGVLCRAKKGSMSCVFSGDSVGRHSVGVAIGDQPAGKVGSGSWQHSSRARNPHPSQALLCNHLVLALQGLCNASSVLQALLLLLQGYILHAGGGGASQVQASCRTQRKSFAGAILSVRHDGNPLPRQQDAPNSSLAKRKSFAGVLLIAGKQA